MKKLFILFIMIIAPAAFAQIMLTADLDGAQEVPAVTTTAKGTAFVVILPDLKTITYRITYARLQGNFSASHFHLGAAGSNGGVLQGITFSGNTAQGTWLNVADSLIAKFVRGLVYINIHSSTNASGEIRGQLNVVNGIGFGIAMNGAQQVPAVTTTGTGTGYAVYDGTTNSLTYRATLAGLSTSPAAAHFHNAAAGSNGGVIQTVTFSDSTTAATWSSLSAFNLGELFRKRVYLNVHTSAFPNGEIRGQLIRGTQARLWAKIDGSQEVPAVGTTGKGTMFGVFSEDADTLAYSLTYNRLSGNYSASHFHLAPAGTNGPVALNFPTPSGDAAGYITPISDSTRWFFLRSQLYFNVHSSAFPNGEIRGQVVPAPQVVFTGRLNGASEVPGNNSPGKGTAVAYMNGTGGLEYQLTFRGLTATPSGAHFHKGVFGSNGGVVHGMTINDSTIASTWNNLTDANWVDLLGNSIYANVHTPTYTGGEIRAQMWFSNVYFLPVPVELSSFTVSAANGIMYLRWETSSEKNNRGFEIEKSIDNNNFVSIGFVTGSGTTTERKTYSFTDTKPNAVKMYYRLKQIDYDGSINYSQSVLAENMMPAEFGLKQNYPNPFNPSTVISFSLPVKTNIRLAVYAVTGAQVALLASGNYEAGNHSLTFNAADIPAGIYFYRLESPAGNIVRKLTLLK